MSIFNLYDVGKPLKKRKLNYGRAYSMWYALLSNKCINLFTWEGLPFEQKEIELRLHFFDNAVCGVNRSRRYNDRLIAAVASGYGVTEYADKWDEYIWTCPGDSGTCVIGVDGVLLYNNSSLLSTRPLVERYSHLLAHAELSLQAILINSRATGIIATKSEKQKQDVQIFYDGLEDGRTMAIVDDQGLDTLVGAEGLRHISTAYPSSTHIMDFWQIRQNLYKEFLAELGISKSSDKRERLITNEVRQDEPLYKYALDDMLQARKTGAAQISELFSLDVSVDINEAVRLELTEVVNDGQTNQTE